MTGRAPICTTFDVRKNLVSARLYASALGAYRLWLGGEPVSDERLVPGWRDYRCRVPYRTYDVTSLLRPGRVALAALLGEAWWSGAAGLRAIRERYGQRPHLRLQLELHYEGGVTDVVGTGAGWRGAFGAPRRSDLLLGDIQDGRRRLDGWVEAEYDDTGWPPVTIDEPPVGRMVAAPAVGVRVVQTRAVSAAAGVLDTGRNAPGWLRLDVDGPPGAAVVVRHAEALEADGSLHTANLRQAEATDQYVLRGGPETLEPAFTTHGFRYAVAEADASVAVRSATGCVVQTPLERSGTFSCADPLVNEIFDTVVRSELANSVEVPTDCPQRDERLGWLGDAYIRGPVVVFLSDAAAWLDRWYDDILDAQGPDGSFPDVAPLLDAPDLALAEGAPGWGDAGITLPWLLYRWYGNPSILQRAYPAACRWIDLILSANPDGIWRQRRGNDYGDWLGYVATPKDVFATAILATTLDTVARIARATGRDPATHQRQAAHVRDAFIRAFVADDGRVTGETQTAYALALCFDLVPRSLREAAGRHLAADLQRWDQLTTGYHGTAYLLQALTQTGHVDLAYDLLLRTEVPSWGHQIRSGATTFWERWDSWTADRGWHDPILNSLNHASFGSVGRWLHATVAGLDAAPDAVGFSDFVVAPRPGGGLASACAAFQSTRGTAAASWQRDGAHLELKVQVPATAMATVRLPAAAGATIITGGLRRSARAAAPHLRIGPGVHHFAIEGAVA